MLVLFAGAAFHPRRGRAQAPAMPTVGVLVVGVPGWDSFWRVFRQEMTDLGYVEGTTIRYEFRSDEGVSARLPDLAADLVDRKVDLIVTWYTPPALAAKRATSQIPIVMALAGNPVETGLVQSLARPGGNVTGMAGAAAELAAKCTELVRELLPAARGAVALANAADLFSRPFVEYVQRGGLTSGLKVDARFVRDPKDLDDVFKDFAHSAPDALIVQPSLPRRRVAELAIVRRIPAISVIHGFAEEGGLMSYAPAEAQIYRRAAGIVVKILKGAEPANIPVEQPTKFDLSINMRTARAIGVSMPMAMLARADVVIE